MNEIADGTVAVASVLKAVNYSLIPFPSGPGSQLVNSADPVCTSVVSGSIDFPRRSAEQRAIRKASVGLTAEGIKRAEIPFANCCWCEFENNSGSICATRSYCAIK